MRNKAIDYTGLIVAIIGALNWRLIGFLNFNLVSFLFGNMTWLSRIIYALVGLCGLYLFGFYGRRDRSDTLKSTFLHDHLKGLLHQLTI